MSISNFESRISNLQNQAKDEVADFEATEDLGMTRSISEPMHRFQW